MKLLLIQICLWIVFIISTARVGVLLVPFGSLAGIVITILSPNAPIVVKIVFSIAGLMCVLSFSYGLKFRKEWKGILANITGLYVWCLLGYIALSFTS